MCESNEHREEYAAWYKEVSVAQNALVDISHELGIEYVKFLLLLLLSYGG